MFKNAYLNFAVSVIAGTLAGTGLVAIILLVCSGCATAPAAPKPLATCMSLLNELNATNTKDGYTLSGNEQGPAGEVVVGYTRDTDGTMRVEIMVPKNYPAPPPDLKIDVGPDCSAPNGTLYKTFHRELLIPGKKA